jgi:uncharacterized SAM-dependent methyltransferase
VICRTKGTDRQLRVLIDLHTASQRGSPPTDIVREISSDLSLPPGQRQLPTLLLYEERGLRLYDNITTNVPEYYLFGAEEGILKTKANEIVHNMHQGKGVVSKWLYGCS